MKICLDCTQSISKMSNRKRCLNCAERHRYIYNYFYKRDNPEKMRQYRKNYRKRKRDENCGT